MKAHLRIENKFIATNDNHDLRPALICNRFKERVTIVTGAGQSALPSAAILLKLVGFWSRIRQKFPARTEKT